MTVQSKTSDDMSEKMESGSSLTDIVTSAAFVLVLLFIAVIATSLYFRESSADDEESVRSLTVTITPKRIQNVEFAWSIQGIDEQSDPLSEPQGQVTADVDPQFFGLQRIEEGRFRIEVVVKIKDSRLPFLAGCSHVNSIVRQEADSGSRFSTALIDYRDFLALDEESRKSRTNTIPALIGTIKSLPESEMSPKGRELISHLLSRYLPDSERERNFDYGMRWMAKGAHDPSRKERYLRFMEIEEKLINDRDSGRALEVDWTIFEQGASLAKKKFDTEPLNTTHWSINRFHDWLVEELFRLRVTKEYGLPEYDSPFPAAFFEYYAEGGGLDPVLQLLCVEIVQLYKVSQQIDLELTVKSGAIPAVTTILRRQFSSTDNSKRLAVAEIELAGPEEPPIIKDLWAK